MSHLVGKPTINCNLHNDKGQTHFTILHVEYSGCNSYQVQDGVEYLSKYRVINL